MWWRKKKSLYIVVFFFFFCRYICKGKEKEKNDNICPATKFEDKINILRMNEDNNDYEYDFCWKDIYVLGDIHGDFENSLKILIAGGIINNNCEWICGKSLFIQTGDIWDRGPDGVEVFSLMLHLRENARIKEGDVILLLGNHDVLNMFNIFNYANIEETYKMGGINKRKKLFSKNGYIGSISRKFLFIVKVNDIIFVHAGVNKYHSLLSIKEMNKKGKKELEDMNYEYLHSIYTIIGPQGLIWTRIYFEELSLFNKKKKNFTFFFSLKHLKSKYIIVGHTCQLSGIIQTFYTNKLIAIDTGLSKYMNNSPHILKIHNNLFYDIYIHHSVTKIRKLF